MLVLGAPLAKVGLSANLGVLVFKASILNSLGGPSANVGLSAKFGVVVFKASILDSLCWGSIGQSRVICQVWCSGIQGIYSQFSGEWGSIGQSMFVCQVCLLVFKDSLLCYLGKRSISQSRFTCQVWCTGIPGISALGSGGPLESKMAAKYIP